MTRSMGAVGTSADNAACESFHASPRRESLQGARYNTRRRHSVNGHLSPDGYER
ncbi:hypothetical protein ACIGW5_27895 [Streptomyces prasinus]|uniref:hypothetical protein n=1 Tax=Streptomyces prasinus TaxID=67345 RepID=UPI0037D8B138